MVARGAVVRGLAQRLRIDARHALDRGIGQHVPVARGTEFAGQPFDTRMQRHRWRRQFLEHREQRAQAAQANAHLVQAFDMLFQHARHVRFDLRHTIEANGLERVFERHAPAQVDRFGLDGADRRFLDVGRWLCWQWLVRLRFIGCLGRLGDRDCLRQIGRGDGRDLGRQVLRFMVLAHAGASRGQWMSPSYA